MIYVWEEGHRLLLAVRLAARSGKMGEALVTLQAGEGPHVELGPSAVWWLGPESF